MSSNLQLISVRLPEWMIEAMDQLVSLGLFPSRSEVIREAVRELVLRYIKVIRTATREGSPEEGVREAESERQ